jgi:hypothetical protein
MKHTNKILVLAGAALSMSGLNALASSTTVNKDEIRAIVAEMLADAQNRSSLLQGQGNAGYDKKFFLASPDNNYRLNIGGYVQFRYGINFGNDDVVNEYQSGFSFRTTRLEFSGHVVNPDLKFLISGDFADTTEVTGANFPGTVNTLFTPTAAPFGIGIYEYNVDANGFANANVNANVIQNPNPNPVGDIGALNGFLIRDAAQAVNVLGAANAGSTGRFIDFNNNNNVDAGEFVGATVNGGNFDLGGTGRFIAPTSYTTQNDGFALKDAVIDYTVGGGWYVRGGQYKLPFLKEELVADTNGLSAERSITNSLFTGGRGQGVGFGYRDETFRFMADYSDGFNSDNTTFSGDNNGGINQFASDYSFTFRGEYSFAGNLDDWKQYTSQADDEFKAYVGAAFHIEGAQNDNDIPAGGFFSGIDLGPADPQRYISYTIDGGIKGSGFSLYAAFVGANTRFLDSVLLGQTQYEDFADFGVNVTGAWRFIDTDEAFIRWDGVFHDSDRFTDPNAEENYHFLTVGWNHYFAGQAARFTVDSVIALTETSNDPLVQGTFGRQGVEQISRRGGSPFGDNQLIYDSSDTGQVGVRFQFQLMF